jgi:rhodanese-related sulfurtransferase
MAEDGVFPITMTSGLPSPSLPGRTAFFHDLKVLCFFATSAVCAGLLTNQFRDQPLPLVYQNKLDRLESAVSKVAERDAPAGPLIKGEVRYIDLHEFQRMAQSAGTVIVDARPEIFHRLGHIPKALPLPRDEFDTYYTKQRRLLEADKARPMLIYCNGGSCEDSDLVATALRRLGFDNIAIFRGGWHEWTENGLPEEKS